MIILSSGLSNLFEGVKIPVSDDENGFTLIKDNY